MSLVAGLPEAMKLSRMKLGMASAPSATPLPAIDGNSTLPLLSRSPSSSARLARRLAGGPDGNITFTLLIVAPAEWAAGVVPFQPRSTLVLAGGSLQALVPWLVAVGRMRYEAFW